MALCILQALSFPADLAKECLKSLGIQEKIYGAEVNWEWIYDSDDASKGATYRFGKIYKYDSELSIEEQVFSKCMEHHDILVAESLLSY